ncbi:hypothetical protein GGS26DRAFT_586726 [Hypomontagnella submonticulosa]|nr:hypothetical protein GGS26DRAFT_586726 [Hypomontagnella submonticulosa]
MSKSPSDKDVSTSKSQEVDGGSEDAPTSVASTQAEMAQAFKDLARGERQAAALEASLTSLESKLDALLASVERSSGGSTLLDADHGKKVHPADPEEKEPEAK